MQNIPVMASRSEAMHSVYLQWPEGSWPTTMEAIKCPSETQYSEFSVVHILK